MQWRVASGEWRENPERKVSKHPEEFGHGAVAGVAGPESANNAASTGAFVPMLALGLPTGPVTAVLMAALIVHGDGSQTRDFVYVADAVAHLIAAMRHLRAEGGSLVLNVCTGHGTSVLELARTLGELQGRPPRLQHGPARAGDIARSVGDPAEATARLGLRATTPLAKGLAETLAWLQPAAV